MGWLSRLTAKGREAESMRGAEGALARGDRARAWSLATTAIVERGSPDALRLAAKIARARGDDRVAIRIDRAADDPSDGSRAADAAGALAESRALGAAIAILERALALSPFDAVLRSDLAVLLARAARPAESVACLALHPCLADDPGALFQFAWSSMLAGDAPSAEGCVATLARVHPELARVLADALARDAITPPDRGARDWLFVEHGAVLLRDGVGDAIDPLDPALIEAVGIAIDALGERPSRAFAASDADEELAAAVAASLGVEHAHRARAGIPAGLVVARDARSLDALADHLPAGAPVLRYAARLGIDDGAAVPDVVGALAREDGGAPVPAMGPAIDGPALRAFVAPRREHVRARRARAFVPDAPIAWPAREQG